MISWIQTILQKHNKWLFGILLAVIIVAFVFTIGATPGIGSGDRSKFERNFFGFNLASPQVRSMLTRATEMSFALSNRRPQQAEFEVAVKQRAVMLYLADRLEIPSPTEEQLAAFIQERPAFIDPQTGNFSSNEYTRFLDTISQSRVYSEEDVAEVMAQDWRIQRVAEAISGPGYVLPYVAARQEAQYRTVWSVETAITPFATFTVETVPTDEELQAFFEQTGARYENPPQMTVQYLFFDANNYLKNMPAPSEEELQLWYTRNISKWPKDAEGQAKPLADIREQVIADMQRPQAARQAAQAGDALYEAIYNAIVDKQITDDEAAVLAFVKEQGHTLQTSPAFSPQAIPADFPLPREVAQAAAQLTGGLFYTDPIQASDGAYMLFRGTQIPASMPALAEVRERVLADYKTNEKNQAFTEHGEQISEQLQAAVKEGQSFTEEADKLGLTTKSFDDFTIMNPPEDLPQYYFYQLADMNAGQVSPMQRYGPEGVFLYVKKKDVPEIGESDDLKEAMTNLGFYYASATAQGILRDLVVIGDKMAEPKEF